MFYPNAAFPSGTVYNFEDHPFGNPTAVLSFTPTLEILFWQPYFLVMKAIAYIIFVIAIGRIFELAVYTIFAPLPIATFASDTTHDVGKSFLKNYIATVMQIAVIVCMFVVYVGVFSVIAVILIVFLLFRTVNRKTEQQEPVQETQTVTEETEAEETGWRFYPIDLVVLGVGGGFCSIMIIRERRKAKEGLN